MTNSWRKCWGCWFWMNQSYRLSAKALYLTMQSQIITSLGVPIFCATTFTLITMVLHLLIASDSLWWIVYCHLKTWCDQTFSHSSCREFFFKDWYILESLTLESLTLWKPFRWWSNVNLEQHFPLASATYFFLFSFLKESAFPHEPKFSSIHWENGDQMNSCFLRIKAYLLYEMSLLFEEVLPYIESAPQHEDENIFQWDWIHENFGIWVTMTNPWGMSVWSMD